MARFFTFAALVVGGLIVADILIHPAGTAAAASGLQGLETPVISGLLGGGR